VRDISKVKNEKVAVVIGGTGQIGRTVVERFLDAGCRTAVVSLHSHTPEEFAYLKDQFAFRVLFYQADITLESQVTKCFRKIEEDFGRIDYLVYTVGVPPDTDTLLKNLSISDWDKTFDVYVKGFFLCFREGLKMMVPGTHMMAVSSAITRFPNDMLPPVCAGAYAAAKSALDEFLKWARREAHEQGILLSRFAPGAVDTPFHQKAPPRSKPPAVLPMQEIAVRIVEAMIGSQEIDLQIVAGSKRQLPLTNTNVICSSKLIDSVLK